MDYWTWTAERLPDPGQRVDWVAPAGERVSGGTYDAAGWLPPGAGQFPTTYIPTFWRPAAAG